MIIFLMVACTLALVAILETAGRRSKITRIMHDATPHGAYCETLARSASKGKALPVARLRFGLVWLDC